jgi:hypothetical protein
MDHLQTPDRPCNAIKVPFYAGEAYDGKGFGSYPVRRGRDYIDFVRHKTNLLERVKLQHAIIFLARMGRKLPSNGNSSSADSLEGVRTLLKMALMTLSPSRKEYDEFQETVRRLDEFTNDLSTPEKTQEAMRMFEAMKIQQERVMREPTLLDVEHYMDKMYSTPSPASSHNGQFGIDAWRLLLHLTAKAMAQDESIKELNSSECDDIDGYYGRGR